MNICARVLLPLIICLSVFPCRALGVTLDITPGSLQTQLESLDDVVEIELQGSADVRDFRSLRNLPRSVETLRMDKLRIKSYTYPSVASGERAYFPADELPEWSFFTLNLKNVILPAHLVAIGEGAFAGSAVRDIVIPDGVVSLGEYVFHDARNLESVNFPASLMVLGKGAFSQCVSLANVDLSSTSVVALPDYCFAGNFRLAAVSLPAVMQKIGREVFRDTAVKELDVSMVYQYADYALSGMTVLESINLSPKAEYGVGVLVGDVNLTNISGSPSHVPELFATGCSNLDVAPVLSEAVTVADWALSGTTGTSLSLPMVTLLSEGALADLKGLYEVDVRSLEECIPDVTADSFEGIELSKVILRVSAVSEDLWREHPVWGCFRIISDSISGMEEIGDANLPEIHYSRKAVHITSSVPIEYVGVFTPSGLPVNTVENPGCTLTLNLENIGEPYVIVTVKTSVGSKASKLML